MRHAHLGSKRFRLVVGAQLCAAAVVFGATAAQAVPLAGVGAATAAPVVAEDSLVQKVHGCHRNCRWSSRSGWHYHVGTHCKIYACTPPYWHTYEYGYYYGPYLYWGPRLHYYRGYRPGRRIYRKHLPPAAIPAPYRSPYSSAPSRRGGAHPGVSKPGGGKKR